MGVIQVHDATMSEAEHWEGRGQPRNYAWTCINLSDHVIQAYMWNKNFLLGREIY